MAGRMRPAFPFLLLAGSIACPAAAQQRTGQSDDIIVVGRGLPARPGDAAFDTVTIDAQRIA